MEYHQHNQTVTNSLFRRLLLITLAAIVTVSAATIANQYVSANFASSGPHYQHLIRATIPSHEPPYNLTTFLADRFPSEPPAELAKIAAATKRFDNNNITPDAPLNPGTILLIGYRAKSIVPGLMEIHYSRNQGNGFGLISEFETTRTTIANKGISRAARRQLISLLFAILTIAFTAAIFYFTERLRGMKSSVSLAPLVLTDVGLGLFTGGGLANAIDRVYTGYVVDYIRLIPVDFPIFNLADVSLTTGFIFVLIGVWYSDQKKN